MKRTQDTDIKFNLERELDIIAEQAHGCDIKTVAYSMALLTCLAYGKKFQQGIYTPDPSDNNCWHYDQIVSALKEAWDRFVYIGRDESLATRIERIQTAGLSKASFRKALSKWLDVIDRIGTSIEAPDEPEELRRLAVDLLQPEGVVYNPFAGQAKYGEMLKLGEGYVGSTPSREMWGIGMIRLLMAGAPTRELYCEAIPYNMLKDGIKVHYPRVISTLPFRYSIEDDGSKNMPVEDFVLSKVSDILTDTGRMVVIVPVGFLNRGGRSATIRRQLTEEGWVANVITLPMKMFQHHARIQTAIVVLQKDEHRPAHFLNAVKCIKNDKLDIEDIKSLMENDNYCIPVSLDKIRENNYSWHPVKYEDDVPGDLAPGHSKRQLRSYIIPTGRKETATGQVRYLTLADLSKDPFSYFKSQNDIPLKDVTDYKREAEIKRRAEFAQGVEEEIQKLRQRQEQLQEEITTQRALDAKEFEEGQAAIINRRHEIDAEIYEITRELDNVRSEIENLSRYSKSAEFPYPTAEYEVLAKKEAALSSSLISLRNESMEISRRLHRSHDADLKVKGRMAELEESRVRVAELQERLERNLRLMDRDGKDGTAEGKVLRKIVHPSLIVGGNKPYVQFAYVEASPSSPVFLGTGKCHAFKVDQDHIDLGYLVYIISKTEFKDFGESLPMVTEEDILDKYVDVIDDIAEQKAFVHEIEMDANPLKKEMHALRRHFESVNAKFDAAIGFKQHEMGHYMYQIGNSFNRIFRIINKEAGFLRKEDVYRQMHMIEDSMKGINSMLERLGERESFGPKTPIDLRDYFKTYVESAHPDGYELEYGIDMDAALENIALICEINEAALDSAVHCIRHNAWLHGFQDDKTRTDYCVRISLGYDKESDNVVIDFINNGTPMAKGLGYELYSSPEGKAGNHAHSGKGGAFVCEMAKAYDGECQINPNGWNPYTTTIRLIFPCYHE